jgi:viroplasmin and RNaseH domain-containing protein
LLITAIGAYFKQLDTSEGGAGYINENHSIEIDLASQRTYLESKGVDTSSMSEQEIKEANTDSWVFLAGQVSILDAIEDVKIRINKV